jgi:hypothetical protein
MQNKPNIQHLFYSLRFEWVVFALFLAAYVTQLIFNGSSVELIRISDLELNQATQYGVDVSKRVSLFNRSAFVGFGLFLLFLWILFRLKLQFKWLNELTRDVFFSAAIGLTSIATRLAGFQDDYLDSCVLMITALRLILFGIGMRYRNMSWLRSGLIFGLHVVLAFNIYNLLHLLVGTFIRDNFVLFFGISICIIYVFVLVTKSLIKPFRKVYFLLLPLSIIPLCIFIGLEFQVMWLVGHATTLGYKKLIMMIFFGSILTTGIIYIIKYKLNTQFGKVKNLNTWVTYPFAVFLLVLLRNYSPFITSPHELFELANPANAIMRIHQFKEIPFVDFISSHLFSEQWFGILYTWFYGFNGTLDFMSWEFLNAFFHLLICFWFIKRLSNNFFYAFVFVGCMTWLQDVFFAPVIFALPVFFTLENLWKRQSLQQYVLLVFLLVFSCMWRLDTGLATCIAAALYVLISMLLWKDVRFKRTFVFKSVLIGISSCVIIVIGIFLLKGADYPMLDHIKSFFRYISGDQVHGRPFINRTAHILDFNMNHKVFPMIGLMGVGIILFTMGKQGPTILLKSALFLYLLYFANVQRGLVRHGFAEQNEQFLMSTFIVASCLLVISFLRSTATAQQIGLLFAGTSLVYMTLKVFPIEDQPSLFHQTIHAGIITKFPKQLAAEPKHGRMILEKGFHEFPELNAFLRSTLKKHETFFDFSNSPMLYFYCKQRVPGYFNQPLQNTVGEAAQNELIKQLTKDHIPVVIYSSDPPSYFDAIDNIHNTQRYHLITEYILKNYVPLRKIEGKEIWIKRNHPLAHASIANYSPLKHKFYLGQFPCYAQGLYKSEKSQFKTLQTIHPINRSAGTPIPFGVLKKEQIYVSLHILSAAQRNLPLHLYLLDRNNKRKLHLGFTIKYQSSEKYLVRLSNSYAWYNDSILALEFSCSDSIQVKRLTFIQDKRFENR